MLDHSVPTLTEFEHIVEAIREVTVGVQEVESGDEEHEPVTDHFRSVDYNQQPASHSDMPSRMDHHDPSCFHRREESEGYFSTKYEVVQPCLLPKPTHAQSEPPVKSTSPVPVRIVRAESDPTRCDSAVDSVLAPDLTETHFDIHGLKRYTNAELEKEVKPDGKLENKPKKDSGAGFEIEDGGSDYPEEAAALLEMPVAQSLDVPDRRLLAEKVVDGYFDF